MSGRRAMVGLCMLCAFAFSAFAVQSASAATKGTTLFTCVKEEGGAGFSREHCAPGDAVTTGAKFKHVPVAENTTTEVTGTTINTEGVPVPPRLFSVQSGVEEELESKLAHILYENEGSKSWVTNAKDPETGEHYYHGEVWLRFTEVSVIKPKEKGCKVVGGEVTTKKLKETTKGQGDEILFEPASGTVFAEFTIEGCSILALNGLYKVEGKIKAQPNGATVNTTLANTKTQGTLKLRGQIAQFESSFTVRGTDKAAGDKEGEDKPLSSTTVETP